MIKGYSERDICTKLITPALLAAGWQQDQFREEVNLSAGRVMVRGKVAKRLTDPQAKGGPKRADYVLYAMPHVPLATIEAKKNKFPVGQGMQQSLGYAESLDAPFAFSSNGSGFLMHDRTGLDGPIEQEITLEEFPSYAELFQRYRVWKGWDDPSKLPLLSQPNHVDSSGREPRYYQQVAINRAVEAVAAGRDRMMLVMASVASGISVSMRNVSRENVTNLPMPLPPLAEQERIVARVDRLLAQCDRVAAKLHDRQSTTEQLLTASIHRLLDASV